MGGGDNKTTTPPFPNWCRKYAKGGMIQNRVSGEKTLLSPEELAMYDFLFTAQVLRSDPVIDQRFNEGMHWFESTNPDAYKILLD